MKKILVLPLITTRSMPSSEHSKAYYDWYINHSNKQKWRGKATERYLRPSKEQWEAVQRNGTVVQQAITTMLPSPTFRYVIRLYPK